MKGFGPWLLLAVLLSWCGVSLAIEDLQSSPQVEVSAELERLMSELGFEVKGFEQTDGAIGHAAGDEPVGRLHLLLENFDHVIIQAPAGGIERVIILGEKSDYVPPPVVVAGTPDQAEEGVPGGASGQEIVLTTQRKGPSHLVTLGLEGPNKQRVEEAMLIDTGADRIVLPISLLSSLGMGLDSLREQQVQTANGSVDARIGSLAAIWVGEMRIENVEVAFIDDQKLGGTSLLGMSLLGRFRMTIDDEKSQLTLATK
ncbi:retropepsin-like aspartic protease family protein [Thiocystis violacea]|uniref:retropepsin-like aspartic protease family protein n=1 Tax=Thiocystis violacea TaxID=13725 RepID=UPI0019044AEC|nr:retropepsin-like aspartic protease [Thiocystis violacea]MBK1722205.1 peptidase A2A [Thiocystis violacea]